MPKKFKNVSPLGALDVPALGQVVEPGEVFTVPDDLVAYFDGQAANFQPVVPKAASKTAASKAADKSAETKAVAPSGASDGSVASSSSDTTQTEGN